MINGINVEVGGGIDGEGMLLGEFLLGVLLSLKWLLLCVVLLLFGVFVCKVVGLC